MVLVRILLMSKSGFEDEVLIKLIVGVVKHVTIDELGPVDYRGSIRLSLLVQIGGLLVGIYFYYNFFLKGSRNIVYIHGCTVLFYSSKSEIADHFLIICWFLIFLIIIIIIILYY
jgi:hypothetical protein